MDGRMSTYVDPWDNQVARATVMVSEEQRIARVTYRNECGKPFRVNVVQRSNPIGFHAKLPGNQKAGRK